MKSSIEIRNEVIALDDKIAEAEHRFNSAEGDAKDAIRDEIMSYKGEIKALNGMLDDVLAEEEAIRNGGGVPLAASPDAKEPVDTMTRLFGTPKDFKAPKLGDWFKMSVSDAAPDYGLPRKERVDYTLPDQLSSELPMTGFLDSLPRGTTDGDIKYFTAAGVTNAADFWDAGDLKASSSMKYAQAVAMVSTIAHGMPVLETELRDYGQLRSKIDTELLAGLHLKEGFAALSANETSGGTATGIIGVLNNPGIQKFTKAAKDKLADAVRKMKTDSFIGSKFMPTHLAVHPYVTESLELDKDANGRYLNVMINGRLWALRVVEDMNLVTGDVGSEKYGAMVYWNGAATWFTKMTDSLAVGIVNDQFMRNELTIRAEGQHALKVTYPKSFVYLEDTGVTR